MYKCIIKRLIDILLSLVALIILLPVFLILSCVVLIFLGKPILFAQDRIGKSENPFKLYKFRSMTNERDTNGNLVDEQKRLTKIGIFLRSTSLDELPELWSILKGDMSFVGPRPLPVYYGPYFLPEERKRHTVRGGLIPPDSLCGLTIPTWEVQFEYDIYYANNVSLLFDWKIILATFKILYLRMKTNYGTENRPHLDIYRSNMEIHRKSDQNV